MKVTSTALLVSLSLLFRVQGIDLDLSSDSSVKNALSTIAYDMMSYYKGNQTGEVPGLLPGPCTGSGCYYWWTAGGMWGQLINYYQYTGDTTYQQNVLQALAFQIGPDKNYNPPNQSKSLGIDDQAFWAFAAMEAAEAGLPNLQDGQTPSWIELAQAVFDFQVPLWDTATCDGGFRWQIYSFNAGYNLKNTASNGAFFALAARLARYTGNSTYSDWAVKVYDWLAASSLLETKNDTLYIWDNTDISNGCADSQDFVWTYNYGLLMLGSAMMYNHTNGSSLWKDRVDTILSGALDLFFPSKYSGVMSEIVCEPTNNCNNDQSTFKAYLSRWMAVTSVIAPYTADKIDPALAKSAQGAAAQCIGGDDGSMCGRQWYSTMWDDSEGVGQQMSALAVIGATRMKAGYAPLRASENPSASSNVTANGSTSDNSGSGGSGRTNDGSHAIMKPALLVLVAGLVAGHFTPNVL